MTAPAAAKRRNYTHTPHTYTHLRGSTTPAADRNCSSNSNSVNFSMDASMPEHNDMEANGDGDGDNSGANRINKKPPDAAATSQPNGGSSKNGSNSNSNSIIDGSHNSSNNNNNNTNMHINMNMNSDSKLNPSCPHPKMQAEAWQSSELNALAFSTHFFVPPLLVDHNQQAPSLSPFATTAATAANTSDSTTTTTTGTTDNSNYTAPPPTSSIELPVDTHSQHNHNHTSYCNSISHSHTCDTNHSTVDKSETPTAAITPTTTATYTNEKATTDSDTAHIATMYWQWYEASQALNASVMNHSVSRIGRSNQRWEHIDIYSQSQANCSPPSTTTNSVLERATATQQDNTHGLVPLPGAHNHNMSSKHDDMDWSSDNSTASSTTVGSTAGVLFTTISSSSEDDVVTRPAAATTAPAITSTLTQTAAAPSAKPLMPARLAAGCIPILADGRILVVSSTKKPEWILPKGGWECDETVQQSAVRECFEEAGCIGVLATTRPCPTITFETRKAREHRTSITTGTVNPENPACNTSTTVPPSNDKSDNNWNNSPTVKSKKSKKSLEQQYTHVRMTLFPLYVTKVLSDWPESLRVRKAMTIQEAIRTLRSDFQPALQYVWERQWHRLVPATLAGPSITLPWPDTQSSSPQPQPRHQEHLVNASAVSQRQEQKESESVLDCGQDKDKKARSNVDR